MITWVFCTLILVFLPINIHENHWILLAANFWVHPKDASLFEMASLMGKPKGVATGGSELDYFHGTLPGWGSYKSRYYTNTTQWWKRLESPWSSKGYVLKKSWDAVSILTCSCLKDEWILFKVIIKKWSLKHIYFVKLEVIFPCLQYLLLNFRQSIPARHRKMTTKTWHAYHFIFNIYATIHKAGRWYIYPWKRIKRTWFLLSVLWWQFVRENSGWNKFLRWKMSTN